MYWLGLDRRTQLRDRASELERQCFDLFPERWAELYRKDVLGSLSEIGGDPSEAEIPITDPSRLDDWFESISAQRSISGAELAPMGIGNIPRGEWT